MESYGRGLWSSFPAKQSNHGSEQKSHEKKNQEVKGDNKCLDVALPEIQEELIIDLVQPFTVSQLKQIANLMFISGYGSECPRTYISVRRDALDECLSILEMEKLSIEDMLKSEFQSLKSKIKTQKTFVRVSCLWEKATNFWGAWNS